MAVTSGRSVGIITMDVRQLRYFVEVVEAKSFTRAAERIHIAQPALGFQVRKLEDELGVKLLHRHSRGVDPTEAGQALLRTPTRCCAKSSSPARS